MGVNYSLPMPLKKKSNLARFKKTMHGLIEFACLLEQSDPRGRENILAEVEQDDPDFLIDVLRKVVYFEELIYLDDSVLAEILTATSPKILAYALKGMPDEFREAVSRHVGHREKKALLDEEEQMKEEVGDSFLLGARKQVLKIARSLEAQGKFSLEAPSECPRMASKRRKIG